MKLNKTLGNWPLYFDGKKTDGQEYQMLSLSGQNSKAVLSLKNKDRKAI